MSPEHRGTPTPSPSEALGAATRDHASRDHARRRAPTVGGGTARVGRTADVVLARLIADEASFARRVHRTRESAAGHRATPA